MRRTLKWFIIGSSGLFVLFPAVLLFAIARTSPAVVDGTDRPELLPERAEHMFRRSEDGFRSWKVAEFTISENDFRDYANKTGWQLFEVKNYSTLSTLRLLKDEHAALSDNDLKPIPAALLYERRASNNGGNTVVYDPTAHRAYHNASHG